MLSHLKRIGNSSQSDVTAVLPIGLWNSHSLPCLSQVELNCWQCFEAKSGGAVIFQKALTDKTQTTEGFV